MTQTDYFSQLVVCGKCEAVVGMTPSFRQRLSVYLPLQVSRRNMVPLCQTLLRNQVHYFLKSFLGSFIGGDGSYTSIFSLSTSKRHLRKTVSVAASRTFPSFLAVHENNKQKTTLGDVTKFLFPAIIYSRMLTEARCH